jgi:hypothetical protein
VGDSGTILATTNGGATWSARNSGTTERFSAVAFPDATHGWAVGGGTILATTDGGATWSAQSSGSAGSLWDVAFSDSTHGWAVGYDYGISSVLILATTNGGATWRAQSPGSCGDLWGVAFSDATHGWAVGDSGTILATTTGGFPPLIIPRVTSFTPASGPVGTAVTLTGSGFSGATAVAFHGATATFSVVGATRITTTVPAGATTTGPIAVTTPAGTSTSATSFTVVVTPQVTLKLSRLTRGAVKLGKPVAAKGNVTPTSLARSKVKLTVQKKKGGTWVAVKRVARTVFASGFYDSWRYKPVKRGAYRMRATIAKSAAHAAAKTPWRPFTVK